MNEVLVCGQKREVMTDAKLGKQSIDRSDLNAATAACRAQ
jgi:hypothetical protein